MMQAALPRAFHRFPVDGNQTKLHPVAHQPLLIIHKAPIEATLYGNIVSNAPGYAVRCDVFGRSKYPA